MHTPPPPYHPQAHAVLNDWLAEGLQQDWPTPATSARWFASDPALDQHIAHTFGPWVQQACQGELQAWEAHPYERLALIILLDQFTRNIYRGTAQAFAGDPRAQALATRAIHDGTAPTLPWAGRSFLGMPLMHAETLAQQDASVHYFTSLVQEAPTTLHPTLNNTLRFAHEHRDLITRFDRFPHRNAALGRHSTAQELAYLENGARFGQ